MAAQVNQGFLIYVVPIKIGTASVVGLVSAFFDDEDEPLTMRTPMSAHPEWMALAKALFSGSLNVHLFDEHGRELLGYESKITVPPVARLRFENAQWLPDDLAHVREQHDFMPLWFGVRDDNEDENAIEVRFERALFPEDIMIQDMRTAAYNYHGNPGFSLSSLERTNPGPFQEDDIVRLLVRVFPAHQIYLNPLRADDNKEICDVLVITDRRVMIIQAKDSANTEAVLKKRLLRKRQTARKKVVEALDQVRGAVRYIQATEPLTFFISGKHYSLSLGDRPIHALVIVKELFSDQMDDYWELLEDTANRTGTPCVALDYPELTMYASHLPDEESFFGAYDRVYGYARGQGHYPRLRFGLVDQ